MDNFRWITENLGGSRAPDVDELDKWKEYGIDTIVNLLEGSYGTFLFEKQKEKGFNAVYLPLSMYSHLEVDEIIPIYEYIDELLNKGKKVVVHCKYGRARTGTILAGYLIYKGKSYNDALDTVMLKGFLPETFEQISFLQNLEKLTRND